MRKSFFAKLSVLSVLFAFVLGAAPAAAQEAKNDKETRRCFDKFDEVWRPVLRRDPYKLEAAKFRIRELAASGKPVDEVRPAMLELLKTARENTPKEDWANNIFAGVAYLVLGEKGAGVPSHDTQREL